MRAAASLLAVLAGTLVAPSAFGAEIDRPWQLAGARAEGLAYTPIAPTAVRKVCLVDTGVNQNADTLRVTSRLSLDGTQVEDTSGGAAHGTLMAMHMAAERNGTGMVGTWPLGEIVSYRANQPGTLSFSFSDYYKATDACLNQPGVAVINLSLGTSREPTPEERERLTDIIAVAHSRGVSVVASAGNQPGPVENPGSFPGVFTVAGSAPSRADCEVSAYGPEVDLRAPGCDLEDANPFALSEPSVSSGTSQASAMVAQVLAAMQAYAPGLTGTQAEDVIKACGAVLDADCALRQIGRADVMDAGLAALATPTPPRKQSRHRRNRFAKPRLLWSQACFRRDRARRCARGGWRPYRKRRGRIVLRVVTLPRGAELEIRAYARRGRRRSGRKLREVVETSPHAALRLPRKWAKLRVRFIPGEGVETKASRPVYILRRG
jgi:hypothetical protein